MVAGDRQTDGLFPLWSIRDNSTISSLTRLTKGGLIDPRAEMRMGDHWKQKIGIRTPDMANPILSLSGGNQQKVLFARALGSDADIILMDDPMRGVDIGTKQEVYGMLQAGSVSGPHVPLVHDRDGRAPALRPCLRVSQRAHRRGAFGRCHH